MITVHYRLMFWLLFLCHLIGDYPLQTAWLVHAKRTYSGLLLHVGIHLIVMLVLTKIAQFSVLPYLLLLTVLHYGIDSFKNYLWRQRPQWVVGPYLLDQVLHILSLLLVSFLIEKFADIPAFDHPPYYWTILISGYLLATHVWFISERIFYYRQVDFVTEVTRTHWQRMIWRGGILTLVFGGILGGYHSVMSTGIFAPYLHKDFGQRVLVIDSLVGIGTAILMWWVIG